MDNTEGGIRKKSKLAVFELVPEKEKNPMENLGDIENSSPSEYELVINELEEPVKQKVLPVRLTVEPLNLHCEWSSCNKSCYSWEEFNTHLTDHAVSESGNFICQWVNCDFKTISASLLIQHVSFHGYLTKIKNIGQNVLYRNELPKCHLEESYTIPIHPNGYTCEWEYCSYNFNTVYEFYAHMEIHIKNNPKKIKKNSDEEIVCNWKGCKTKYSTQYKLADHLKVHTKQKVVACPTCCALFCSKTKFADHRKKQLPVNLQNYQCSQCLKLFASERLLRDHMRSHINHYKCTMCDMTCPKPSILATHIRYKHVKDKYYKCAECSKAFVSKQILLDHIQTHTTEKKMKCNKCDFKCRSKPGLENHYIKNHGKQKPVYECHCCKRKLKRGSFLTRHLKNFHNYHWPPGHSRFNYRKDQDGIFRLQTVRYESLEVTQEIIKSESKQINTELPERSYYLKYDNDGQSKYILSISEDGEHCVKIREPEENNILTTADNVDKQKNLVNSDGEDCVKVRQSEDNKKILITIHDIDEQGNLVHSETMETKEQLKNKFTEQQSLAITEIKKE